jgi:rubredoxin
LTVVGSILLGITFFALLFSIGLGGWQLFNYIEIKLQKRALIVEAYEIAVIEDQLHEVMIEMFYRPEPVTNYRHNIHCPLCGRFSKKVMEMDDVVDCHAHGIQVRWRDIPVDWASIPVAPGVQFMNVLESASYETMMVPLTQPIDIITTPEAIEAELKVLQEAGARV